MGRRRSSLFSFGRAVERYFESEADRKQRTDDNMNNLMRKDSRKGEEGPGAKDRKIGRIKWDNNG